jgi:hypothetical protein
MFVTKLGQRAATQAHHQDAFGLWLKQQHAHHQARVFKLQLVGPRHAHATLNVDV